jgi:N-acetylglucosaminyldiphosphoundecaprenol N-acetyl-beta-D-mannosaminyltransferase
VSKQALYDKLDLLGVEVDAITNQDAITYICTRAAPGQPACYVIKPYVEFLDRAYRNEPLLDLLNNAELSLPDGVALVWAAAYLYAGQRSFWRFWSTLFQIVLAPNQLRWPLPDRTAGVTFTWPLLEAAQSQNIRVYLIGKETGSAIAHVADTITKRLPQLHIAGTQTGVDTDSPYRHVSQAWLERTAEAIRHARADIVLIGMGFPLQDTVSAYLAAHLDHGVFIGEGGTFDYDSFGGVRHKAPAWIQRSGLEWAWRLVLEPRRLIRQLAVPRFIWRIWHNR